MLRVTFELSKTTMKHQKSIYGWFDLLGDMGGLLDIIMIAFSLLVGPFNEKCF